MMYDTALISERGPRTVNEDATGFLVDDEAGFGAWFIADGLGGHAHGDIASRTAVDAALACARHGVQAMKNISMSTQTTTPQQDPALGVIAAADAALRGRIAADARLSDMRTTFVAAVAYDDELHGAHLGDSRLYLLRGGAVAYRTRDHSLAELDVRLGEINDDGIRGHPDRNIVLRTLPVGTPAWLRGQPAVLTMRAGDALLLCTDGYWECLYDAEMLEDLSASADAADWLRRMTRRVADRAPHDNSSAICCRIR